MQTNEVSSQGGPELGRTFQAVPLHSLTVDHQQTPWKINILNPPQGWGWMEDDFVFAFLID